MTATRLALGLFSLAAATSLVVACAAIDSIGTGNGNGNGNAGASAASATATDASAEAGVTGVGCGIEQTSGTTMCRGTSACPGLVVDSETFPKCGFRIGPTGASLVCACNGSICGMGSFATCSEAAAILRGTTEGEVCVQLGEGRCKEPSDDTSGGATPTTCDKSCLSECGGGSGCAEICGC